MVRICASCQRDGHQGEAIKDTYDYRVYESGPALSVLEQGKDKGDGG